MHQAAPPLTETALRDALRDVLDPELGYNIVDLGLVYGIGIEGRIVDVAITMTTPGCPA
jgi:metal-sulfur cluster biosynthetic enzyme